MTSVDSGPVRPFSIYLGIGIFGVSPFETLDIEGVGELVRVGTERGRATRPTSRLASAVSTAVTRAPCTTSTTSASTTSPAHRSASPSRASKPARVALDESDEHRWPDR
jgi:hypothetical protein